MKVKKVNTENLFHAYILSGSSVMADKFLDDVLKKHKLKTNHPDVYTASHNIFTINDARVFKAMQSKTAFSDNKKFFIFKINFITKEAQNALLKTIEEPTPNTHIFICCRFQDLFLPTIKSRCQIISFTNENQNLNIEQAEHFLKLDFSQQLEYIKKNFSSKNKNAKNDFLNFLDELEVCFYRQIKKENFFGLEKKLQTIFFLKKRSQRAGLPVRLLAESLAVSLAK